MNKKKVGAVIIMHDGQNNYGSSLQGFATTYIISKLGYDYEIIGYNKRDSKTFKIKNLIGLLRSGAFKQYKYMQRKKKDLREHKEYRETRAIRTQTVNNFKAKYIERKRRCYDTFKDLQKASLEYSVVMVGSDQVWGPLSLYSRFYNLLFVADSVPKFSYASSFGVSTIFPWQKKDVSNFLSRLNLIGVREQRGKEIVKELTGKDATVVLDPTLLLSSEEWSEYIDDSRCKIEEPYILTYVLGERKDIREEIKKMSHELGIKIVNLPHIDNYHDFDDNLGDVNLYDVDPFDFIRLIRDAEYVMTDSFHGTVFSILFHKKFMTFYRKDPREKGSTHSRIDSLLNIMGLSSRLYGEYATEKIKESIDYNYVDKVIANMKAESMKFFSRGLQLSQR